MNRNYLPSKQFTKRVLILVGLFGVILLLTKVTPTLRNRIERSNVNRNLSVRELVAQDTNLNGIQDWEETLWGLDPSADGAANKEYILNKKKSLGADGTVAISQESVNNNDKMAREFFAIIISLQQSGNLNEDAIKNISESVGKNIVAEQIADIYTKDMLKTQSTNTITISGYQSALKKLNTKYANSDIGEELNFIGQAVAGGNSQALRVALLVAEEYRAFGKELMQISVPTSLGDTHLSLANNYEKNARAIENMRGLLDDPMSGMAAIIQYKRYNDALIENLATIRTFFVRNGILN